MRRRRHSSDQYNRKTNRARQPAAALTCTRPHKRHRGRLHRRRTANVRNERVQGAGCEARLPEGGRGCSPLLQRSMRSAAPCASQTRTPLHISTNARSSGELLASASRPWKKIRLAAPCCRDTQDAVQAAPPPPPPASAHPRATHLRKSTWKHPHSSFVGAVEDTRRCGSAVLRTHACSANQAAADAPGSPRRLGLHGAAHRLTASVRPPQSPRAAPSP